MTRRLSTLTRQMQLCAFALLLISIIAYAERPEHEILTPLRFLTDSADEADSDSNDTTNSTSSDGIYAAPQKEGEGEEKVQVQFDFWVFSDVNLETMAEPGLGVYQALSCQTDLFMTTLLQEKVRGIVRLSLEMVDWSFDPTRKTPLSITFQVSAYHESDGQPLESTDIIEVVDDADYEDYIMNYIWKTYPIGGAETEVLRQINKVSYDAQSVDPKQSALLYDTTVCPALSLVLSTWQFGFFQDVFIDNPDPEDFVTLGCEMYTFTAQNLIQHYYGGSIDVTLQHLQWQFFAPDDDGYALNVTAQVEGVVNHANGDKSPIPSSQLAAHLREANLLDFIQNYVHQSEPPADRIWNNVQRTRVATAIQDIVVGQEVNWRSDQSCARVTPAPTPPPTPRPTSDTNTSATEMPVTETGRGTPQLPGGNLDRPQGSLDTPQQTRPPRDTPQPPGPLIQPDLETDQEQEPLQDSSEFLEYCRRALFTADKDANKHLNSEEYINLLNLVGDSAYEGYPFVALPMVLKSNFDTWASADANYQIELEAMMERQADRSPLEQQQAHRDAICQATQAALQEAAASDLPAPVHLIIKTSFLAYNQEGIKTKQEFWDHSEDLVQAYGDYVKDHVVDRMAALLSGRRQLRSRELSGVKYWVFTDSASVYQVKETSCPEDAPDNASCLQPSAKYEVFVLDPTPDDPSDRQAIEAAAQQATTEGIANGNLQTSLDNYNPNSLWSIQATSDTPPPTESRPITPTPVPVADPGNDIEVVWIDDDAMDGMIVRDETATQHVSDAQCGGELGVKGLNATGLDCNSFAGKHIWHIAVIVGLAVLLCAAFLPLLIWGRYPCCSSGNPSSMATMVKGREGRSMDGPRNDHHESQLNTHPGQFS